MEYYLSRMNIYSKKRMIIHIKFYVIEEHFAKVSVDYEPTRDFVQEAMFQGWGYFLMKKL